ncbi:hypothetical protein N7510_007655 [Penicillium lagena]|uniref:uncharacterized protein n=1 Tax=Penicillium lagena TaxID=94218 RepID=UPI002541F3A7|nr:uncharacterized protein N7510_007655 [Penicillium lagena]KAJ5610936.1 hypothetical protein N7510_007655 [Penicillium lagena]
MPEGHSSTDGRVSKTSGRIQSFNESNIAALERELDAPDDQLRHRLNSHPARSARVAAPRTLDDAQENILIQWIQQVKELSSLPTATQITTSANQILNLDRNNTTTISKAWVDRFIERLPDDLKPSKARLSKKKYLESSDLETMQHWFDRLGALVAGVSSENIYNFDETTFRIGEGMRPRMVITSSLRDRPVYDTDRNYTEWITTIECLAANGWTADPFLVFQGEYFLEDWFEVEGLPKQATFTLSPNGRITEKTGWEWIQFFHRKTKDRVADGQQRLLLFRGQPQYLTYKFLRFCEQHLIVPFCFPPNIGHFMQPFDVKAFQDYKQYWKQKHYSCFAPPDDADDEKSDFMEGFPPVREKALRPQVITDAFADQGIFPFDPSRMIQPLQQEL